MSNTYMYEKMVATRPAEIRHDIQLSRKHSHIEQSPTFVQHSAGRYGSLLVDSGNCLQGRERHREATVS